MLDGKYEIIMKTPMGTKKGTVILRVDGDTIRGRLDIMGNSIMLENGTVNGNSFTFRGELKIPMGKVAFLVEGSIDGDRLTAITKTKKGNMSITGKRIIDTN
jgi:hypothetical protein